MDLPSLKSRLSLRSVLSHYGLVVDRNDMLRCPFHSDRTPSMQISGEAVYCHSTNCPRHGKHIDVIDFVMYKEGLSKHEAILKCKSMAGEVLIKQSKTSRPTEIEPEDFTETYAQMLAAVRRSSKAREYLESRGLEAISDVGYNPGTLYKGVRQCVVFPLRNQSEEVASLYGRSITESKARHFYTSNRSGLYPGWPAAETTRLVLAESVIDAATIGLYTDEKVLALRHVRILVNYGYAKCVGGTRNKGYEYELVDEKKVLGEVVRSALAGVLAKIKAVEAQKSVAQSLKTGGLQNGLRESLKISELSPVAR